MVSVRARKTDTKLGQTPIWEAGTDTKIGSARGL
jgi:hypothetical protein